MTHIILITFGEGRKLGEIIGNCSLSIFSVFYSYVMRVYVICTAIHGCLQDTIRVALYC